MSTERSRSKTLLRLSGTLIQLFIFINLSSDGVSQTILLTCPVSFMEGSIGKIKCLIDTSGTSSCSSGPNNVQFAFQSVMGAQTLLCQTPFSGACGQEPVGDKNCSCAKSDSGIKTFQLNLLANKTAYEGGSLTCTIDCRPSPSSARNDSCASLTITDTPTSSTSSSNATDQTHNPTSTPSSNVTEQTNSPPSTSSSPPNVKETTSSDECDKPCKIGLGVGLGVGIPVVATTIVVIYCTLTKKCCFKHCT